MSPRLARLVKAYRYVLRRRARIAALNEGRFGGVPASRSARDFEWWCAWRRA